MIVIVLLFARARELAGTSQIEIQLPQGATIQDLRHRLELDYPVLKELIGRSAFGLNDCFAKADVTIPENAVVALLPPVSGG